MSIICIIVLYYERLDLTSRAVHLRHLYVTSGMGLTTKCLAWFRQSVVVGYFLLCCIYGRSGSYQQCLYDGSPPTATQIQDVCAYDTGFGVYKFELHAFRPLPSAAWHCTTEEISFG
jgi:hypothetical protein